MNSWMTEYHQIEQYHENLKQDFIAETQFLFPYTKSIDRKKTSSSKSNPEDETLKTKK